METRKQQLEEALSTTCNAIQEAVFGVKDMHIVKNTIYGICDHELKEFYEHFEKNGMLPNSYENTLNKICAQLAEYKYIVKSNTNLHKCLSKIEITFTSLKDYLKQNKFIEDPVVVQKKDPNKYYRTYPSSGERPITWIADEISRMFIPPVDQRARVADEITVNFTHNDVLDPDDLPTLQ